MARRVSQHFTSVVFMGHSFSVAAISHFTGKAVVEMEWWLTVAYVISFDYHSDPMR